MKDVCPVSVCVCVYMCEIIENLRVRACVLACARARVCVCVCVCVCVVVECAIFVGFIQEKVRRTKDEDMNESK